MDDKKRFELKDFYRAKDSDALIQIGKEPEILKKVNSDYYLQLFWGLEKQSTPRIVIKI